MEKLLLFDVDGVIVDSFDVIYEDLMQVFRDNGVAEMSKEEYRELFLENPLAKVLNILGKSELTEEELDQVVRSYRDTKLFDGIKKVIEELAESNILAVVTSTLIKPVEDKFDDEDISQYFAAYLGPQAAVHKDKKIQMALEEFGKEPSETTFISDTVGDILEAKKTGVQTISVTWGYHNKETMAKAEPDYIVNTPKELYERLHIL